MRYRVLPLSLDLNDPESRFCLSVTPGLAELRCLDWRARPVALLFHNVCRAALFRANEYRGLPEGGLFELFDSPELLQCENSEPGKPGDLMRHFVVSTNEGEWAEFIASHFEEKECETNAAGL